MLTSNLRQLVIGVGRDAARNQMTLLIQYPHHFTTGELTLHSHHTFGEQAAALGLHRFHCAIVNHNIA
ncbi:Uncharacterised protein [Vibrio cholerae]|nr:Uncharacterised protein [Vibrio cholerae]CSA53486.1 Uncharacterised protein [Vibrio cholerae]CSC10093.1 Uncharacterised protein [Vibrio cholerae]